MPCLWDHLFSHKEVNDLCGKRKPCSEAGDQAEGQETEGESQEGSGVRRTGLDWSEEDQWTNKENSFNKKK